jgi:hypothetical protein
MVGLVRPHGVRSVPRGRVRTGRQH